MAGFLRRGADYLSAHRLYQKNHHGYKPIQQEKTLLHQPWALDWKTDVLDLLDIATRIGMSESPSLVPALRLLLRKQGADGRWPLEYAYRTDRPLIANLLRDVEQAGSPGKWVTLTALLVLKRCRGLVQRILSGEVFPSQPEVPAAGFLAYNWDYSSADEARVRAEWAEFAGMPAVLDGLVEFAGTHGVETGWYDGFVMGPSRCREWCASQARLVPARNIRTAFPVARTMFLAPRGLFKAETLAARLGTGVLHEYSGRVRPGSWVERTLWRVRVDNWNNDWDTVGIAILNAGELPAVTSVMTEALAGLTKPSP